MIAIIYCLALVFRPSSSLSTMNNIATVAGTGTATSAGSGSKATATAINAPAGVWVTTDDTVYFSEYNGNCVRKFSNTDSLVQNFAGVCSSSASSSGNGGYATSAFMNNPLGIATDSANVFYLADYGGNFVRRVSNSVISSFAGSSASTTSGNGGKATSAGVPAPKGIWFDTMGVAYVSTLNSIRSVSTDGIITSISGTVIFIGCWFNL